MSMVACVILCMKARCDMQNNYIWYIVNAHHGYAVLGNAGKSLAECGAVQRHRADQSMMIPSWDVFERASV